MGRLKGIIEGAKRNEGRIDGLKERIGEKYREVREKIVERVERDEEQVQQWVNQFYYPHLVGKGNLGLLTELAQDNYRQLPSKSVKKLVKTINSKKRKES